MLALGVGDLELYGFAGRMFSARAAEQPAQQLQNALHVPADVIEHHRHEQQSDNQEAAFQDTLARLGAERAPPDRLGDIENDLSAVQNWNRQEIEDREIDADQDHQQ